MTTGPLPPSEPPWPPRRRRRLSSIFLAIAAAVVALGAVLLAVSLYPTTFGLSRHLWGFPFGGGFLGLFLLVWGGLLLVRISWWRARGPRGGPGGRRWDPAIVQARQRYARGEITREQFFQIVQDLRPPQRPPP